MILLHSSALEPEIATCPKCKSVYKLEKEDLIILDKNANCKVRNLKCFVCNQGWGGYNIDNVPYSLFKMVE